MRPFNHSLIFGLGLALATPGAASDGALEINQTCAVQTGCFPGDAAGFPVTINSPGSYVLTSGLDVSSTTSNAIEIEADGVAVDLNGFTLSGPGSCSLQSGNPVCSGGAVNDGIRVGLGRTDWGVRNGRLLGFGRGIGAEDASRCLVESVIAAENASAGLSLGDACSVRHSLAVVNGGSGIEAGAGVTLDGNGAHENAGAGLVSGNSATFSGNAADRNGGAGIECGEACAVNRGASSDNDGAGVVAGSGSLVESSAVYLNGPPQLGFSGSDSGYQNNALTQTGTQTRVSGDAVDMGTNLCSPNCQF